MRRRGLAGEIAGYVRSQKAVADCEKYGATDYATTDLLTVWGTNSAANLAALAHMATAITNAGGTLPTVSGAKAYTANSDGTVTLS